MDATTGSATRRLPHNLDAERAVLGSILIDNTLLATVNQYVRGEHFYDAGHRAIFQAIADLEARSEAIDPTTLANELERAGRLELAGGAYNITRLESYVLSTRNVANHARIVRDKALKRSLIQAADRIADRASAEEEDAEQLLTQAQESIFTIQREQVGEAVQDMAITVQEVLDLVEERRSHKHVHTGLPSGFQDLDDLTTGFQKSDLIVLAGRTSMGKTAFALNLAANAAIRQQKPVLFFSLEMSRYQLVQRILAIVSGINISSIRAPRDLTDQDMDKLHEWGKRIGAAPLLIDDTPGIDIADIRTRARHHRTQREDLGMICVDYLQLVTDSAMKNRRSGSRQEEVAGISGALKAVAREIDVPLFALAQLSRQVEQRRGKDKQPILSDLRESGAIEQDADLVIFVHRPDFYGRPDEDGEVNEDISDAQILVRKHRNGRVGDVELFLHKPTNRFISKDQ